MADTLNCVEIDLYESQRNLNFSQKDKNYTRHYVNVESPQETDFIFLEQNLTQTLAILDTFTATINNINSKLEAFISSIKENPLHARKLIANALKTKKESG